MKKIFVSIYTVSFLIFTGCYYDSEKATVRINLGNIPIASHVEKSLLDRVFSAFVKDAYAQTSPQQLGVIRIHLAAYIGDSLIAKESIDTAGLTSSVVEFTVPSGDDITILVVGENLSNEAAYYGYNHTPVNLKAGKTENISITVDDVNSIWIPYTTFSNDSSVTPNILFWNSSGVKTKYYIEDQFTSEIIYSGYNLQAEYFSGYSFNLYVEFEAFGLKTPVFNLNFG